MFKGFRESGLFLYGIDSKVDRGNAGIGEAIGNVRPQKARVRRQVYPEVFLGGVIDDLVNEIRAEQRFATGRGEHAAGSGFQPVDGAARCVFGHAFDAIVVGPAIVTVQIAFPFGEEVGNDRLKFAWHDA